MKADLSGVDPLFQNLVQRCCVGDVLTRAAELFPDRTALVTAEEEIGYAELDRRANAVARGLLALGVEHQEPVAFLLRNRWEFVATFFACAKTGRIALPLNLMLSPEDTAYILRDAGPRIIVAEREFLPLIERLADGLPRLERVVVVGEDPPAEVAGRPVTPFAELTAYDPAPVEVHVDDRDIVHCLYTSGTTSAPKGVLTSHVAVVVAALSGALQNGGRRGTDDMVQVIVLPLFHTTGLDCLLLGTLVVGGIVVLHQGFDAGAVLAAMERHRATNTVLLPMMWQALLAHPDAAARDTSSMRVCMYAMAPMPAERLDEIRRLFPNADVILGSGQTEFTPPTVVQWPRHQYDKASSWGPAVATTDVRIMGPDGTLLPRGEEGEIVYRGPQAMAGYWNRPDANADAFAHGWFHSGDVGYMDDEGVVWFTDRLKDIVKTGGENVSSVEVERVLLGHSGVADCAVVGLPDERWGEAVTAFVVRTDEAADDAADDEGGEADLIAHCRAGLAGFKTPKSVVFVDELPRTGTGKIQKHEIRAKYV